MVIICGLGPWDVGSIPACWTNETVCYFHRASLCIENNHIEIPNVGNGVALQTLLNAGSIPVLDSFASEA